MLTPFAKAAKTSDEDSYLGLYASTISLGLVDFSEIFLLVVIFV